MAPADGRTPLVEGENFNVAYQVAAVRNFAQRRNTSAPATAASDWEWGES